MPINPANHFELIGSLPIADAVALASEKDLMGSFNMDREYFLDEKCPARVFAMFIVSATIPREFTSNRAATQEVFQLLCLLAGKIEEARAASRFPTFNLEDERAVSGSFSEIADGFYTVQLAEGGHRTFRVKPWKSKKDGTRTLSLLVGESNEDDYKGIGTISPDGRLRIWSSVNLTETTRAAVRVLAGGDREVLASAREGYAVASGRCARCRRLLTVPASINRGLGPECAGKI
jgi:hypothetical protein